MSFGRRGVTAAAAAALCGVALAVAVAVGCGSGTSASSSSGGVADKGVVKIGVLAPLTGDLAADGQDFVNGVKLAVKEINASGGAAGYKFEVVSADTKTMVPDAVVAAFQRLVNSEKCDVLTTGYASSTNFEIKNAAEINIPYFVGGGAASFEAIVGTNGDQFPTVWCPVPSYDAYGTDLPKLIEQWASEGKFTLHSRKVAIISADNPYSEDIANGLTDTFKSLGWTITLDQVVPQGELRDWSAIIAKIKADPPDVIIDTDYLVQNEAAFMDQFLQDPTDSLVFIQYGPSLPEFVNLTKDSSTGVLYNWLGAPITSPENELWTSFEKAWTEEYKTEPGPYAEIEWESVYIYKAALEKVGDPKDHLAVGKAIGEVTMKTCRGTVGFDSATHLAKQGDEWLPISFYQLWEGDRILLTTNYATGDFQLPPWMSAE